jgi:cell division protein FtsB
MNEIQKLKQENQFLKEKIKKLSSKLKIAESWMTREVKDSVKKISKRKITSMTCSTRDKFMQENNEEIIANKIQKYF